MGLTTIHKVALLVALPVTGLLLYFLVKKNDEDEEEDIRPTVVTSRQTVIEVKVPRAMAGAIIGTQGCKIKQLQDSTGARINFKDENPDDTERVVVIRGTHAGAQQAEMHIRKIVTEQPMVLSEEILIPEKCTGRIIGRNGDTVRHMSRVSQAKILVDRSGEHRTDGMKSVVIQGSTSAIANAKGLIEEKIEEERAFQARRAVQTSNRQERVSNRRNHGDTVANGHQEKNHDAAVAVVNPIQHNGQEEGSAPWRPPSTPATLEMDGTWPAEHRDYLQCYVSAVVDAGNFSVQVLNSRSSQLDGLMQDMTQHYQDNNKQSFAAPLQVGDVVAAPFQHDDLWYRARVVSIKEDVAELYYLDFGDTGDMSVEQLQSLRADYLSLPFQAFECFLANVKPVGDEWTDEASDCFEDLTHAAKWKVVMARTVSYRQTEKGSIPCLDLIDTNGAKDVHINEELVSRGHAVWAKDDEAVAPEQSVPRITDGSGDDDNRAASVQVPPLSQGPICASPGQQEAMPQRKPVIVAEDTHQPESAIARQKYSTELPPQTIPKTESNLLDSCAVKPSSSDLDLIAGVVNCDDLEDVATAMGGVIGTEEVGTDPDGKKTQDHEVCGETSAADTDIDRVDLDEFNSKTEELVSCVSLMSQLEATKHSDISDTIDTAPEPNLQVGATSERYDGWRDPQKQIEDSIIRHEFQETENQQTMKHRREDKELAASELPLEFQSSGRPGPVDKFYPEHHESLATSVIQNQDASVNTSLDSQSNENLKSNHAVTHRDDIDNKISKEEHSVDSDYQELLGACASPGPLSLADVARHVVDYAPTTSAAPEKGDIYTGAVEAMSDGREPAEPDLSFAVPDVLIKDDVDRSTSVKPDDSSSKACDRGSRASSESEIEILSEENNIAMTTSLTKCLDLDIKYTKSPIDGRSRRGPSEGAISDASSEIDVLCDESQSSDPGRLPARKTEEAAADVKGREQLTEACEPSSPVSPVHDDVASLADSAYASLGKGYETEESTTSLHEETVLPVASQSGNRETNRDDEDEESVLKEVECIYDDAGPIPSDDNTTAHSKSDHTTSASSESGKNDIATEIGTGETAIQWNKADDFEVLFGLDPRFGVIRTKTSTAPCAKTDYVCKSPDSVEVQFGADPRIVSPSCMHASSVGMDPWHKCTSELPEEAVMLFGNDPRFGSQTTLAVDANTHKSDDVSNSLLQSSEPVKWEEENSSDEEIVLELIEDECASEPLLQPDFNELTSNEKNNASQSEIGVHSTETFVSSESVSDLVEEPIPSESMTLQKDIVPEPNHSNIPSSVEESSSSSIELTSDCDITTPDHFVEGAVPKTNDHPASQAGVNDQISHDYCSPMKEQWQSAFKKVADGMVDVGGSVVNKDIPSCASETANSNNQCVPELIVPCEESGRPQSPAKLRWHKAYDKVCEGELKSEGLPHETSLDSVPGDASEVIVNDDDTATGEQEGAGMKERWQRAIEKVIDEFEQPPVAEVISPEEGAIYECSPHLPVPQDNERPKSPIKQMWQGAFRQITGEDPPRLSDLPAHYRDNTVNTATDQPTGCNISPSNVGEMCEEVTEPSLQNTLSSVENTDKPIDIESSWYDMVLQDSESESDTVSKELEDLSQELDNDNYVHGDVSQKVENGRPGQNRGSLSGTVLYPEWMKKASASAERPVSPFPSTRHEPLSLDDDQDHPDYFQYIDEERVLPGLEGSPPLHEIQDNIESAIEKVKEASVAKLPLQLQTDEKSASSGSDPDLNLIKLSDYWEDCSDGGFHSQSPDPEMFSKALQEYRETQSRLPAQNPELASSKIDPDEYDRAVLSDGVNNLLETYMPGQDALSQEVVRTLQSGDDASGQCHGDECQNDDCCDAHNHDSCVVSDTELHRADINITESILHPCATWQQSDRKTGIPTAEVEDLDDDSLEGDLDDSLEVELSGVFGSGSSNTKPHVFNPVAEPSHVKPMSSLSSHDDDILSCDSLDDNSGYPNNRLHTSSPSTMSQDSLSDEPSHSLNVAVPEERSQCVEDIDCSFTDDSIEQEGEDHFTGSQLEATVFELEHTPTRETAELSFEQGSLQATGGAFSHPPSGIDVIQEEPDQMEVSAAKVHDDHPSRASPLSKIPRRNRRRKPAKVGSNPPRHFQYAEDSTAL